MPLPWDGPEGAGSIIVICATDAPLLPHQCNRLAQRCALGVGRTGGAGEHSSGDLILAFSTVLHGISANEEPAPGDPTTIPLTMVHDNRMDPLFYAAIEATEAAIVNVLLSAETMTGYRAPPPMRSARSGWWTRWRAYIRSSTARSVFAERPRCAAKCCSMPRS